MEKCLEDVEIVEVAERWGLTSYYSWWDVRGVKCPTSLCCKICSKVAKDLQNSRVDIHEKLEVSLEKDIKAVASQSCD